MKYSTGAIFWPDTVPAFLSSGDTKAGKKAEGSECGEVRQSGRLHRHSCAEFCKILLIRMGEGTVEILQHEGASGTVLHGFVAVPHGLRHLSLAHVGSGHLDLCNQIFPHPAQNLLEIGRGSAGTPADWSVPSRMRRWTSHRSLCRSRSLRKGYPLPEPRSREHRSRHIPPAAVLPGWPEPAGRCCLYGC